MKDATVIFAPSVDEAILNLIDYVDPSDLPTILNFIEKLQKRLVKTLSTYPLSGTRFQENLRFFAVEGYVFLYEYAETANELHVVDMIGPGKNWR